jgi:hypothetical protein
MVSRDDVVDYTDSVDGAHESNHEIVYTTMLMLPGEWYVCAQDHYLQYLPS